MPMKWKGSMKGAMDSGIILAVEALVKVGRDGKR
jgi:hypothetical protein